ncbi:hypothetical protein BDZ45DRAFT_810260 [Acephala macrosclerotiorum]|nr:hypothetical protein BDZ45DRAFT_810260 [Acephala macrosclerotiorum]
MKPRKVTCASAPALDESGPAPDANTAKILVIFVPYFLCPSVYDGICNRAYCGLLPYSTCAASGKTRNTFEPTPLCLTEWRAYVSSGMIGRLQVAKDESYFRVIPSIRSGAPIVMLKTLSGTVVKGLSSYFYVRAGISTQDAYNLLWGQSGISAAGTLGSWFILNKVGRKKLMCGGMVVMFVLLFVAGGVGIPSPWAGAMILLLSAVADFSARLLSTGHNKC